MNAPDDTPVDDATPADGARRAIDADAALQRARLARFLGAMLPIAVAFCASYVVAAAWLRSAALSGGAFAVALYVAALASARALVARGRTREAAMRAGYALLVMVAVGAAFLHFLMPALVLMPLAAVALVLPYATHRQVGPFLAAAVAVVCEVVALDGLAPALFAQPPEWFQKVVVATAVVAATGLTVHLLGVDHARLSNLLGATQESLESAEAANAAKDAFLAAAAHDLRTPITTLRLQTESLTRGPLSREIENPRLQDRLARIDRQTQRLASLVNGLLDVSRIASGRYELQPESLDVAAVVNEVTGRLEDEIARSGCDVRLVADEGPVLARADRLGLEQVTTNLLSNALKYGAGKPVELRVARRSDGYAQLAVRDHGLGIPEEEHERVFERFERGASASNYPGLGVGLWIVRELVRMMGGTLALASREGEGATFTLCLPPGEPAPGEGASSARATRAR